MQKIIQITSGRGPVECCRVVAKVQELILKQARQTGIETKIIDHVKGDIKGTLLSATIMVTSNNLDALLQEWCGTIQWIAQSPYRRLHKRKNWFIGVEAFDIPDKALWNEKDIVFETTRSSGPGGQNVNKVETAVRGTHIPSGIQVLASDSRSQLENKKLCLQRLQEKVNNWTARQFEQQQHAQWQEHNELERGGAVKVIKAPLL